MNIHRLLAAVLLVAMSGGALCDEPLPPPARVVVCSPNGKFCATSNPKLDVTVVARKSAEAALWSVPGWHRWLFVADDGQSIVVGYQGMNLVPTDVALSEPVLFFYHREKLVRTITLGNLYRQKSQMQRTVSHFAWANTVGIDGSNRLVLDLVDGRKMAFDVNTGKQANMTH